MYNPIKDGVEKSVQSVRYVEAKPPAELAEFVHCFWELKTEETLPEEFNLHALPDACVNIMFNILDTKIAGVTALHTTFEVLNLGTSFHYAGIQLLPGVWQGSRSEIADRYIGTSYQGSLPLIETNTKLAAVDFAAKQQIMSKLVDWFIDEKLVVANPITAAILANIDTIHTVADMAKAAGISARQLQRTLKQTTGFSPHDFLKVIRLQHTFSGHYAAAYTDQSHFIHSFRRITGYTPAEFAKSFKPE